MPELYFETLWEKHKPSQKLPLSFENKLKESMIKMMSEVWSTSAKYEREFIKKNFSDFADGKLYTMGRPIA
jgi:hypothetical protein